MTDVLKPLEFEGDSARRLREFPIDAKVDAGYALHLVQCGEQPPDFKPFPAIGKGVEELRVWDESGTYRVMYVARFPEAVYVLHCFKKKSEQTEQKDVDLAARRYADVAQRRLESGL